MATADEMGPARPITSVVAMLHVADVERSSAFYRLLGFEVGNRVPATGPASWAWLYAPAAANWRRGPNLMLARAEEPVDRKAQAVLFYLYAADLRGLRDSLLANGVAAGEITHPEYLPAGEFGLVDPDGYCLMIAQSTDETP
ncbi:MAG: VOC family protein [Thermoanaerobaculia bacterium]